MTLTHKKKVQTNASMPRIFSFFEQISDTRTRFVACVDYLITYDEVLKHDAPQCYCRTLELISLGGVEMLVTPTNS